MLNVQNNIQSIIMGQRVLSLSPTNKPIFNCIKYSLISDPLVLHQSFIKSKSILLLYFISKQYDIIVYISERSRPMNHTSISNFLNNAEDIINNTVTNVSQYRAHISGRGIISLPCYTHFLCCIQTHSLKFLLKG